MKLLGIFLLLFFLNSCTNMTKCDHENITGTYLFYSDYSDTSSHKIIITLLEENKFETNGLGGSEFWFPIAPMSGQINDCEIIIDEYIDVKKEGLPSPGGEKRYYYESLSGYGEYHTDNDSIKLNITYNRTGDFSASFSGELNLIKEE